MKGGNITAEKHGMSFFSFHHFPPLSFHSTPCYTEHRASPLTSQLWPKQSWIEMHIEKCLASPITMSILCHSRITSGKRSVSFDRHDTLHPFSRHASWAQTRRRVNNNSKTTERGKKKESNIILT